MKQLLQNVRTGQAIVLDVPAPKAGQDRVLVHVAASLVSAGTERMVVDFAEKNLLKKARSRPDLVRQTVDKAKREGVLTTLEAVQNRLDQPMALGYSCAGTVIGVGEGVTEFKEGDRVACAGGGFAVHAEAVSVPKNLVAKLPKGVGFEEAAFATVGAIALQGIRLSEAKLGELVAVIGVGLLGQLTVQMLKAAGCVVVGMDIQPQRAELALELGADAVATSREELDALCRQLSGGQGADAVLITADTKSNEPVELAGEIARDKGIVVAVGAVGTEIPRKSYYEKELDFRISRSYGPGRYDSQYEEEGHDYPYSYVRWTEGRNIQAFVQLLHEKRVNVTPIITHRFPIENSPKAYELITGKTGEPSMGVLLIYPEKPDLARKVILHLNSSIAGVEEAKSKRLDKVRLGVVGAGNYANATFLPAVKGLSNVEMVGIGSGVGLSARHSGDRFGFAYCTTDMQEILEDSGVNTVAILTRHHLHARQAIAALEAGKHVFVEKPICLNEGELEEIITTYQYQAARQTPAVPTLTVGYNRRFAPFVVELERVLRKVREPLMLHYRVNAGYLPPNHWLHDPKQGGGRLIGEGCHFIDLLMHLAGSAPRKVWTLALPNGGRYKSDNLLVTLEFANGSVGSLTYVANGAKGFGKEFLEVFGGGVSARLDDYRLLHILDDGKETKMQARLRQDKGHQAEWQKLAAHLTGNGPVPIPFGEIVLSTRATLAAQRSLVSGEPVLLGEAQGEGRKE